MDEALATVIEVLHGAGSQDEATRLAASDQLLAYFREPGFAGILSVCNEIALILHETLLLA